jgi:hypothetical protein
VIPNSPTLQLAKETKQRKIEHVCLLVFVRAGTCRDPNRASLN